MEDQLAEPILKDVGTCGEVVTLVDVETPFTYETVVP